MKINLSNKILSQENLKSKYILIKIFDYLSKKNFLEIIKYYKQIQKRINININNYKDYSELHAKIEIDIILNNEKSNKFINIKKEDEIYYHIYINNYNKESKKFSKKENEKIQTIKIIIDPQVK